MITRTEQQLQEIADAIPFITEINPARHLPHQEIEQIKEKLQKIGEVVEKLHKAFTLRHSRIPWNTIKEWSSIDPYSLSNQDLTTISTAKTILETHRDEINKQAYPDRDIQSGVLTSLAGHLDLHAKEFYGKADALTVLISLTGILVVARAALLNIGVTLNLAQFFIYCSNALPVLWIARDIMREHDNFWISMPRAEDYFTHTDFYFDARSVLEDNIFEINSMLMERGKARERQKNLWYATALLSIIVTLIAAICQ